MRVESVHIIVISDLTLSNILYLLLAVRIVAAGHKMVSDGWNLFEEACAEAGPGELPQLLRSLKGAVTPTPMGSPTTPVKQEQVKQEQDQPMQVPAESPTPSTSAEIKTEPVLIKIMDGGKTRYKYGCPNCDVGIMGSKRGMDAHIRATHTKIPLLCSYCEFTSYNMDSLQRHEREQH